MGLHRQILRFLVGMHKHDPLPEPLLSLGVQDVYGSYAQLLELMRGEGFEPRDVEPADRRPNTSLMFRAWGGTSADNVHPRTLFAMLGIGQYADLDLSSREQPSLVHDLNEPIPGDWHQQWGTVLDSGTLEHLFDVRTALANIAALVRVGGTVLHISPVSGWLNHGFIQPCPSLFFDFYRLNGFEVRDAVLAQSDSGMFEEASFARFTYTTSMFRVKQPAKRVLLIFRARKCQHIYPARVPMQEKYRGRLAGAVEAATSAEAGPRASAAAPPPGATPPPHFAPALPAERVAAAQRAQPAG